MRKIKIVLWLCVTIVLSSCLKEGTDTVVLPSGVPEINTEDEVLLLNLLEQLKDFTPIYEGDNPPLVEGVYLMSSIGHVYASDDYYSSWIPDLTIRFTNQNLQKNLLSYDNKLDNVPDVSVNKMHIMGTGNRFTAYSVVPGIFNGINYKAAIVHSGTMTTSGLTGIYYVYAMLQKDFDPSNQLMDEGVFRIFQDGDGFAENTSWNNP